MLRGSSLNNESVSQNRVRLSTDDILATANDDTVYRSGILGATGGEIKPLSFEEETNAPYRSFGRGESWYREKGAAVESFGPARSRSGKASFVLKGGFLDQFENLMVSPSTKEKGSSPECEPYREKLRPRYQKTVRAFDLGQRRYGDTWKSLIELMDDLKVADYKAYEDSGELTGTCWGDNGAMTFTVLVRQKEDRSYFLDFFRRSGSPFDFHQLRDEVLHKLGNVPLRPKIDNSFKDPDTGLRMDELGVTTEDLNDWKMAMEASTVEFKRSLVTTIAHASMTPSSKTAMQKHKGIIEVLVKSLTSRDTVITRYALVALTNVLDNNVALSRDDLARIANIGKTTKLREIRMRCKDALSAVCESNATEEIKRVAEHLSSQIKINN